MENKTKIAIIGGGMAGLGAAYELAQNDLYNITIFEKNSSLGGLNSTIKIGEQELEIFYHHMFPDYFDLLSVADKLNIKDKVFFKRAKTGIFYKNKIFSFSDILDLIKFKPLTFLERIKTGIIIAKLKFTRHWEKFENICADEWLRKNFGGKIYSILWEPLLKSKFGGFYKQVGMSWFWGRLYERPSKFGYFHGSFSTLNNAFEKYLRDAGIKFIFNSEIKNLEKNGDKFILITDNISEEFDKIIVAAAPIPFSKIAANLLPAYFINYLSQFKYLGVICAILILKRPLTDFYWLNINEGEFPFLGVIEQSNFVSPKVYGNYYPVYLPKYLDTESDFYRFSDEEIWKQYLLSLENINKNFRKDWIVEKYIFRAPFAQPIITSNYQKARPFYKTPVNGLWWVSMSHVYPWDRGIDHAFHSGRELAKEILSS